MEPEESNSQLVPILEDEPYINNAARVVVAIGSVLLPPVMARGHLPPEENWRRALQDRSELLGLRPHSPDEIVPFEDNRELLTGFAVSTVGDTLRDVWAYYWVAVAFASIYLGVLSRLTCRPALIGHWDPAFKLTDRAKHHEHTLELGRGMLLSVQEYPAHRRGIYWMGSLMLLFTAGHLLTSDLPAVTPFIGLGTRIEVAYFTWFWHLFSEWSTLFGYSSIASIAALVLGALWLGVLLWTRLLRTAAGWVQLVALGCGSAGWAAAVYALVTVAIAVVALLVWFFIVAALAFVSVAALYHLFKPTGRPKS